MNRTIKPESALKKEWRLFKEGFVRLGNAYLNSMFDLSPKASRGRFWAFVVLFFLTGFLLSLINYPLTLWLERIQDIFLYFFNSAYRAGYTAGDPISNLAAFVWQVFRDPRNLRFIPLLLAPYFISLQSAAIYLADIFNPDKVPVHIARKHILEVALGGSDETIRISKGEISEEHKKSANYLIGGPGKVVVDLDSVALFERLDGTFHIIGPTGREPGGKATIEGFERFREAIDLRDLFVEVRNDRGDNARVISSRSRDGIPISATDVRFMFSIDRGEENHESRDKSKPADNPYTFSAQAVEKIIYKAASRVTPDQKEPSTYNFLWRENMVSLVRGELTKFMGQNMLNKYFASIGSPEVDRAIQRETLLADEAQNLLPLDVKPSEKKESPKKPEFIPRPQIKNDLFSEFADNFNKNSRDRGVQLKWIGIGTWKSPVEKVFSKHTEAWKAGGENEKLESGEALKGFGIGTVLQKMVELIQDIPLGAYQQAQSERTDHTAIMRTVLNDYKKQLSTARDLWISKGEMVPVDVEDAINIILKVLGVISPGNGQTPNENTDSPDDSRGPDASGYPSPDGGDDAPPMPGFAYEDLIRMVNGDGAAANRLIEHERAQFPNESQDRLVARAIDKLIRDRQ